MQRHAVVLDEIPGGATVSFLPDGRLGIGNDSHIWHQMLGPSMLPWSGFTADAHDAASTRIAEGLALVLEFVSLHVFHHDLLRSSEQWTPSLFHV